MSTKTPVLFPVFDDATEDIKFRKDTTGMAQFICRALGAYLKANDDDTINATSVGAACFVAAHLISLNFEDERKDQVMKGLVATLALNSPSKMLDLATNPPTGTKLN